MSLNVTCPGCEKRMRVKDHFAGKRVRCPDCSEPIQIPELVVVTAEDDFLNGVDNVVRQTRRRRSSDDDEWSESTTSNQDFQPRSQRTSRKSSKPKVKQTDSAAQKIAGTVLGLFLTLGVVVSGYGFTVLLGNYSWKTFQHPSGLAQAEMPGKPVLDRLVSVATAQRYRLVTKKYHLALTTGSIEMGLAHELRVFPERAAIVLEQLVPMIVKDTVKGKLISSKPVANARLAGVEIEMTIADDKARARIYVAPEAIIIAEFITKGSTSHSTCDRFFDSLRGPDGELIVGGAPLPESSIASGKVKLKQLPPIPVDRSSPSHKEKSSYMPETVTDVVVSSGPRAPMASDQPSNDNRATPLPPKPTGPSGSSGMNRPNF